MTIENLKQLRESEDHVEFKAARHNYPFANSICDGKLLPSFEGTDNYQVSLTFFAKLKYPDLASMIRQIQSGEDGDNALNIFQLMALYCVERGESDKVPERELTALSDAGLVKQKRGRWVVRYDSVANFANEVTERQSVILECMVAGEQYATQTLSQMMGIGLRTLQRELAVLEKVGRVRRAGMTKNLKWVRI